MSVYYVIARTRFLIKHKLFVIKPKCSHNRARVSPHFIAAIVFSGKLYHIVRNLKKKKKQ